MHTRVDGASTDGDFVPAERLRRSRAAIAPPPVDAALLARLTTQLDGFAAGLDERERAALTVLLAAAVPVGSPAYLARQPAASILDPEELVAWERYLAEPAPATPGMRSALVMVMKATRLCNLRCTYCHFWKDGPDQIMSFDVLLRATGGALRAPGVKNVEFVWHGGETTLLPLRYFEKALWLQEQFRRPDQHVENALQTNGTRLTDEWIDFCRRFRISVGVSLDGPPAIHDLRRRDAAGRPTAALARSALDRLRRAGVPHGVLLVVDEVVAAAGAAVILDYFLEIGVSEVALLNAIPENTPQGTPPGGSRLGFDRWVDFLRELFALWWPAHRGHIRLRELVDLVGKVQGRPAITCVHAGSCFGGFLTIEPSGEVSACDKYIGTAAYRFGELTKSDLSLLVHSAALATARAENDREVRTMATCPHFQVCSGACPHDRYLARTHGPAPDEHCCGLAPLITDIAKALRE